MASLIDPVHGAGDGGRRVPAWMMWGGAALLFVGALAAALLLRMYFGHCGCSRAAPPAVSSPCGAGAKSCPLAARRAQAAAAVAAPPDAQTDEARELYVRGQLDVEHARARAVASDDPSWWRLTGGLACTGRDKNRAVALEALRHSDAMGQALIRATCKRAGIEL